MSEFRNMPISEVVYGDDHPIDGKNNAHKIPQSTREPEYRYMKIHQHVDQALVKRLARKFPRCRKFLIRENVTPKGSNGPEARDP